MAPILLNAAASFAGNLVDGISDGISSAGNLFKKKAQATSSSTFSDALAQAQALSQAQAAATTTATPTAADQQAALTTSLMGCPEVKSALAGTDPSKPVQLELNSTGGLSLRSANGNVKVLNLSDSTRATVKQLFALRQSTGAISPNATGTILAVDPANVTAPVWSTLPMRH